jgi:NAD(P)H-dependent FMN reductase
LSWIVDGSIVPHFNPDLEQPDNLPRKAKAWRELVRNADGLLISSPEYAAGIPGALKNALDWLVGEPGFYHKPVATLSASQRTLGSHDALTLVLSTMSADIVEDACVRLPLLGKQLTPGEIVADEGLNGSIVNALATFHDHLHAQASLDAADAERGL